MTFRYYMPTRILFGNGMLNELHQQELPGKKALIVTTNGTSVKKFGYLSRLEEQLDRAGVEHLLFDKILPNPIKDHVMEGGALAKQNGVDFVIGLGGGSAIDAAKAIAIMAANEGDYWDYISGGTGKGLPVPNDPLPVVAITTTAGTGTEADPWTVTTKTETNEKIGGGYDKTFPFLSIVDPELMVSVPAKLTAYQGFDALFHSTEGYLNNTSFAMSDMYALKAIELIGKSLANAVRDGSDLEARGDVALANTLAGMVESTSGCISEHSLAHAISAYHPNFEHGAALIAISKAYYTYFANTGKCDARMIQMAKALGKADAASPMDFVTALVELQTACGVDSIQMSGYGMKRGELEKYAKNARETMGGLYAVDPVPLSDADALQILEDSFR
ncbi:iron-containing alcohol dehydrogenase [Anaeromassilibacillus senegalensis]|uniref:iron-containing alcohol dehydrogenase n=1 Tax=Anaeromassilibacillus senegalensis TaxID=1673717 RepID=UPI00068341C8|nr:iron-containing alcohol dehydrogenase [Anaeromassilibacillus senegalensis]